MRPRRAFRIPVATRGRAAAAALGALLALAAGGLAALPDDREQPIYIQSDRAERDERKGTTVYTGEVEVDQGSLHISADRVTISDANDQVSEIVATGAPAKMHQKPAQDREPVYARARTIRYDVAQDVLTLIEDASVTQEGTVVTGDRIVYYVQEQRVHASGGGSAAGKQRVKVVLPPRRVPGERKEPPAAAPQQDADGTP